MKNTIVITGATSGIGLATAKLLAQYNVFLILIGRNQEKGNNVVQNLIEQTKNKAITFVLMDLSSPKNILTECEKIFQLTEKIDVLINNAAYISSYHQLNEDGIEMQMAVNHYAPLILIQKLFPLLRQSEQGRIIQVTSRAHARGEIYWNDINLTTNYSLSKSYNQSKLANLMCCIKLAQLLKDSNITLNSFHPGLVNTEIGEKHTNLLECFAWKVLKKIGRTPEIAAKDAVFLALSPNVKSITGGYFHKQQQIILSKKLRNQDAIEKLWKHSCLTAKLDFNELNGKFN